MVGVLAQHQGGAGPGRQNVLDQIGPVDRPPDLARGGHDFLIGDGRLNYAPEYTWESYYSARLFPGFYATFDVQHYNNPAYNHDRGPVWIESIRLHMEFGLKPGKAK